MFFNWTKPFGERCRQDKQIKFDELGDLNMPEDDWSELSTRFDMNFKKYEAQKSKHSLMWAILSTNAGTMGWLIGSQIFGSFCEMSSPLLMKEVIEYISDTSKDIGGGLSAYAVRLIILNSMYVICERYYWHLRDFTKEMES